MLDGVFEDDYGDWPAGSYIRNPPQSRHTPGSGRLRAARSSSSCVQFAPDDRTFVHAHLDKLGAVADRYRDGVHVSPLYRGRSRGCGASNAGSPVLRVTLDARGGAELFVLEGGFEEGDDALRTHSWLRSPVGTTVVARAGAQGARVWVKTGHLAGLQPDRLIA